MSTIKERTLEAEGRATKPAGVLRVSVDGNTFDLDPRTLTIRENWKARQLLEASEFPADAAHFSTAAAATVIINRTHPDVTFDDVIDALTLGDIIDSSKLVEGDVDNPET